MKQSLGRQSLHVQLTKFLTLVEQLALKPVTAHHLFVQSSVLLAVGAQVALWNMRDLVLQETLVQVSVIENVVVYYSAVPDYP